MISEVTARQGHNRVLSQRGWKMALGVYLLAFLKKNQSTMNNGFQVRIIIQDYQYTQNNCFLYTFPTSLTAVFKE